jgi:prepilin-type N-terminal cleavage/methylation domain-containing protein/prepilin-type processing-associated H-X9-DG protein
MRIAGSGDRSPLSGVLAPRDEPGLRARRGLTLVEVIVVIAAITLLMALSMPAIQRLRETALRIRCQSQLRQIGIALHHYHIDAGHLPPGRSQRSVGLNVSQRDANGLLSWLVQLLPYLENRELYERSVAACARAMPWDNSVHEGLATVIALYRCPLDDRLRAPAFDPDGTLLAFTSYLGVAGDRPTDAYGLFSIPAGGQGGRSFAECYDGLSNTLMVGERPPPDSCQAGQWYAAVWRWGVLGELRGPDSIMPVRTGTHGPDYECGSGPTGFRFGPGSTMNPCDRYHFWSLHPGGANFLFGDASCRYLRYSADPILSALATCSGGEVVEIPD